MPEWLELRRALDEARWIARELPSTNARFNAAFLCIGRAIGLADPQALCDAVGPLLDRWDYLPQLVVMRELVHDLRELTNAPGLSALELALAMIDATDRHLDADPLCHGLNALGWTRVPGRLGGLAVDLAVMVHDWPRRSGPPSESSREDLYALGELLEKQVDCTPRTDWRHALRQRKAPRHGPRYMAGGAHYFERILGELPAGEPRALEIYDMLADVADVASRPHIEAAQKAYAAAIDAPQDRVLAMWLRAALRRVPGACTEALTLARRSVELAQCIHDAPAETLASTLAGALYLELERSDDHLRYAKRWLEASVERAATSDEPQMFRIPLLVMLGETYDRLGDELGVRRTMDALKLLVGFDFESDPPSIDPAADPCDDVIREPAAETAALELIEQRAGDDAGPDFATEDVREHLVRFEIHAAYMVVSEWIGGVVETMPPSCVLPMLLRRVTVEHDPAVRAWFAAAAAELAEDFELWCALKLLQLRREDAIGVTEDELLARDPEVRGYRRIDPARRAGECVAAGERAFAAGDTARARWWVEQASHYRNERDLAARREQ